MHNSNTGYFRALYYSITCTFFFVNIGYSQVKITDTVWYTMKWEICEQPIADFYRVGVLAALDNVWYFTGAVKDYTIDNTIIMEGLYSTDGFREGDFKFYYPDGKLRLSAKYKKNIATGEWYWYYANGKEQAIIYFPQDPQDFRFIKYATEEGTITLENGSGNFTWHTDNFESLIGDNIVSGSFTSGKRSGDWNFVSSVRPWDNSISFTEHYDDGKFMRRINNNTNRYNLIKPATFSFSPQHLYSAETMKYDDLFKINGDSSTFTNIAYYLIEHKPTQINLRYIVFDTAFKRVLKTINDYAYRRIYYNQTMDIDSKLEFRIGAKGNFENITFSGNGIDSNAKRFFPYLLTKFKNMEMPGDKNIAVETNFTIYCYLLDFQEVLPGALQNGFTKKLILSCEKMKKYLHDNRHDIKDGLIDNMLNANYQYYRYRKKN